MLQPIFLLITQRGIQMVKIIQNIMSDLVVRMDQASTPLVKISMFIIFFWFGALKPLGISAAEQLVLDTVYWMPFLSPKSWLHVIGYWEMIIGIFFLFDKTIKYALILLFLQMAGTFMPLFILSDITFQKGLVPYAPTLEGQYIIKNIIIIAAAMVIGGRTLRKSVDPRNWEWVRKEKH